MLELNICPGKGSLSSLSASFPLLSSITLLCLLSYPILSFLYSLFNFPFKKSCQPSLKNFSFYIMGDYYNVYVCIYIFCVQSFMQHIYVVCVNGWLFFQWIHDKVHLQWIIVAVTCNSWSWYWVGGQKEILLAISNFINTIINQWTIINLIELSLIKGRNTHTHTHIH